MRRALAAATTSDPRATTAATAGRDGVGRDGVLYAVLLGVTVGVFAAMVCSLRRAKMRKLAAAAANDAAAMEAMAAAATARRRLSAEWRARSGVVVDAAGGVMVFIKEIDDADDAATTTAMETTVTCDGTSACVVEISDEAEVAMAAADAEAVRDATSPPTPARDLESG